MVKEQIEKKIYYVTNMLVAAAVVVILILTALLPREVDLQISINIGNAQSWYGIIFAVIGEIPSYLILPLAFAIIFRNLPWDSNKNKFLKIMSAVLVFVTYFIWFKTTEFFKILKAKGMVTGTQVTIIAVVLMLICGILTLVLALKLNREFMHKLYKWAVFALVVVLVSFLISRILKYLVARPRFRNMSGEYTDFSAWWRPHGFVLSKNGFKTDNTSFPSGHTTSAANILVFVVLFDIFPKLKKYKIYAYFVSLAFIILTAVSRIVNLAHFLSDVTFAAMLSYLVYVYYHIVFFHEKPFTYPALATVDVNNEESVEVLADEPIDEN